MCLNGSSLMKVHYFQRYHSKENVATANTMLLLSRLYSYSPEKFFKLLKSEIFSDIFEPEMTFRMQERNKTASLMQRLLKRASKLLWKQR